MYELINFETLNSTNTYALAHLKELAHKSVISAQKQTHAQGRFKRKWISYKPENAYFSIVLKPKPENLQNLQNLTQLMCIVLCEEFEKYPLQPFIKWPNDILINGKKISGILAQSSFKGTQIEGFVLGVGVNLNFDKEDLLNIDQPATALNLEINKAVDRNEFIENVLTNFFAKYDEFMQTGFVMIKEDYEKRTDILDKEITVKNMDKKITGIVKNINLDGTLTIQDGTNNVKVTVGDI
ncbi:MAG: biotin--[acetyl-CoA-carboxylase] ligase [Candidatus Gastranaerophilales bacterium]|nr:biotin--[acetyl-CoA-carboxylase] ligase [Candidatus Gastranaerophilales bacterium]